jgi:hypothetical protein
MEATTNRGLSTQNCLRAANGIHRNGHDDWHQVNPINQIRWAFFN